ncbi:recombination protein RecR [Candidatus Woesebacteria bacterium RIFCSPHIGHO2_01_FULL_44_21]|uniref:Recombination protein RecR n=1 Tax=Candidatus Woesebacteria bacterium RIFCSPHIGHO2_01_FULL_44_21 TaxID=1802503 RepID=A0A1F7Z061_9BACT|nr:MAG: recombination protein RecR [Candidatus Woesebacteria bacterium RIFCSPHIGHO2_01_FULL_44_21]OGM68902.1 MAG: recombination protein RecR [Candidatus Woesebacteria bacterium RIFCSPLOWO2_01_FULL_44_24b]
MDIVKPIADVIDSFSKLPGIGPKTAQRLAYYLLHVPQTELDSFSEALANLKKRTVLCSICKNVSEHDPCEYCANGNRTKNVIMVVEQPLDILAFERTGKFDGVYHVLHGAINPLENIGPDEIFIEHLISRVKTHSAKATRVKELIIATNPTMEGEATAMYLTKRLKEIMNGNPLKITRLGMGIPTGAYLEFADETTLMQAMEGRREL